MHITSCFLSKEIITATQVNLCRYVDTMTPTESLVVFNPLLTPSTEKTMATNIHLMDRATATIAWQVNPKPWVQTS
jgi:hypothetical protein